MEHPLTTSQDQGEASDQKAPQHASLRTATTAKELGDIDAAVASLLAADVIQHERDPVLHGRWMEGTDDEVEADPFDDREVYSVAMGFDRSLATVKEALGPAAAELVTTLVRHPLRGPTHADTWLGRIKGDRSRFLSFVEPMVRAAAASEVGRSRKAPGVVECMRLTLVLRSFPAVWGCLHELVSDALRDQAGGTAAQVAWERCAREFERGGDDVYRSRPAVHRSRPSLLSEFRLRLADEAMRLVATLATAMNARSRQLRAANERMHQQSLELVAVRR